MRRALDFPDLENGFAASHSMRISRIFALLLATLATAGTAIAQPDGKDAAARFETRCGWLENPTPGNLSLYDAENEWIIGVQGGYQVEQDWPWPKFARGQWVETNGHHGYGCACLEARVDRKTTNVLAIRAVRARPLAACRGDAALGKKWMDRFK